MNTCILAASPRANGNTQMLLAPFSEELARHDCRLNTFRLYDMSIRPCIACRACQKDWTIFGCPFADDAQTVFDAIMDCDCVILATPIYSWFCTAPLKALLDRLVYGMNKYYGSGKGPSLWAGKLMAIIATCGYRPERGADLFEEGVKRYCGHSRLRYGGMLAERHMGYATHFMDEEKAERARGFARSIAGAV